MIRLENGLTQTGAGLLFLKLDQSTPQTVTASPIFDWLTASQAVITDANKKLISVDYLNQAVKTTSSPTFVGLDLTGLTDGYVPYVGASGLVNSPIYTDGSSVDWTTGNVIYVPLTGDIQTYINAATAGDTLVLAAGTYTITSGITVNKLLHIRGQGAGLTTIACSTDNVDMVTMASSGSVISDMTISKSGVATTNTKYQLLATANCDVNNIQFLNTCTHATNGSYQIGVSGNGVIANIENCTGSATGAIGAHNFVDIRNGTATANVRNCYAIESGALSTGRILSNTSGTINAYNSTFISTSNLIFGVLDSSSTLNSYNCVINGSGASAFDVRRTGGTLTLYDTTLVNNKTSGTITYGGTIQTLQLRSSNDGGAFVNTDAGNQYIVNNAKSELIEDINQLVGTADIKGFWIFDQTGATTSITGRDPDGTVCTLGGNASTLSPAVSGLCPNLTMNGTAATAWSVADADKYSFGDGAGNDSAFSVVVLVNPTDMTNCNFISKWTSTNQFEWDLKTYSTDKLSFNLSSLDGTKVIARFYDTALTTDEGSWHTYCGTANGGSPQAIGGIKVYRDGTQIDDTNNTAGVYAGMTNGTSNIGINQAGTNYAKAKYGVVLIISKELTAAEVSRISKRLLAYSGSFI